LSEYKVSLSCRGVEKSFGGVRALSNIDLNFSSGRITSIIGPNGAGKTTLINILTGFLQPEAGKCFLGQQEISGLSVPRIARLGVGRTFQDLRMILGVPVLENLMLARPRQRGERLFGALLRLGLREEENSNYKEAIRLLRFVGLEQRASDLAGELSYGQQKLLSLACCLAMEAKIILLDEPVAGVHPNMAARILGVLQELRDQGKLIIFIEHDISAVRAVADHVVVMDQGQVIAQGVPGEVLERPEIVEAYLA
jgi:ABC-type branched-subunit amino acid transport system ATPase component